MLKNSTIIESDEISSKEEDVKGSDGNERRKDTDSFSKDKDLEENWLKNIGKLGNENAPVDTNSGKELDKKDDYLNECRETIYDCITKMHKK